MDGMNNMKSYITICKIDSQRGICCMAQETQCLFIDLEGVG